MKPLTGLPKAAKLVLSGPYRIIIYLVLVYLCVGLCCSLGLPDSPGYPLPRGLLIRELPKSLMIVERMNTTIPTPNLSASITEPKNAQTFQEGPNIPGQDVQSSAIAYLRSPQTLNPKS